LYFVKRFRVLKRRTFSKFTPVRRSNEKSRCRALWQIRVGGQEEEDQWPS
jgi:hypothetical protein